MCARFTEDAFEVAAEVIIGSVLLASDIANDKDSEAVLFETGQRGFERPVKYGDEILVCSLIARVIR